MWNTKTSLDGDVAPLFTICINFSIRINLFLTHIRISSIENPNIWKQAVNRMIGLFRMLGPVGGTFWSSGVNHLLGRCCQVWAALLGAVPRGWAWSGPGSARSSPCWAYLSLIDFNEPFRGWFGSPLISAYLFSNLVLNWSPSLKHYL